MSTKIGLSCTQLLINVCEFDRCNCSSYSIVAVPNHKGLCRSSLQYCCYFFFTMDEAFEKQLQDIISQTFDEKFDEKLGLRDGETLDDKLDNKLGLREGETLDDMLDKKLDKKFDEKLGLRTGETLDDKLGLCKGETLDDKLRNTFGIEEGKSVNLPKMESQIQLLFSASPHAVPPVQNDKAVMVPYSEARAHPQRRRTTRCWLWSLSKNNV